jgi:hypothetical protein
LDLLGWCFTPEARSKEAPRGYRGASLAATSRGEGSSQVLVGDLDLGPRRVLEVEGARDHDPGFVPSEDELQW